MKNFGKVCDGVLGKMSGAGPHALGRLAAAALMVAILAGAANANLMTVTGSGLDDDGTTISVSAVFDTDDISVLSSTATKTKYDVVGVITGTHTAADGSEISEVSTDAFYLYVDTASDKIGFMADNGYTAGMNAYFSDGILTDTSLNNVAQSVFNQMTYYTLEMVKEDYSDTYSTRTYDVLEITETPEPATMGLLAFGSLAALSRKRSA